MDECVVSGDGSSSILHEHGHILQSANIMRPAWGNCACGSIDPAQRLSTLIPARQDGTPVRSCTIYLETTTQESHLCERGTAPSPFSKGETFHAGDFPTSGLVTQT